MPTKYYTLKQAVEYLPMSLEALYQHVRRGTIPVARFGGRVYLDEATLMQKPTYRKKPTSIGKLKAKLKAK